jgi:hypothetical protein
MGVVVAAVRACVVLPNAGEVNPPPPRGVSTGFGGLLLLFIEGDGLPHEENEAGAVDEDEVAMVPMTPKFKLCG